VTFFESLLALLLAAIILLQISRRLSLPYPAMLAAAGVIVALIPGSPAISIEPETALALFMAPVVLDAAYDFPIGAVRRMRRQLIVFAVFAVVATAALVALLGWKLIGLPIAAAVALGAIVAPPDAAAATAVLKAVSIPRDADTVLKGESLFNDATALLLFTGALAVLSSGALTAGVGGEHHDRDQLGTRTAHGNRREGRTHSALPEPDPQRDQIWAAWRTCLGESGPHSGSLGARSRHLRCGQRPR